MNELDSEISIITSPLIPSGEEINPNEIRQVS